MATLRIEFVTLGVASTTALNDTSAISRVMSDAELPITGAATTSEARPAMPADASHAILTAVGSAAYVAWDKINGVKAADPTTPGRLYIADGDSRVVSIPAGRKIACVIAAVN